jgi:hypothetical protein
MRRLDRGGHLALGAAIVIALALVLWRTGAPPSAFYLALAVASALSVVAGWRIIGAIVEIRRLAKKGRAEQKARSSGRRERGGA